VAAGALADLVAVDLAHPSLHPPTDLLRSVVYAMSAQAVTDVWVHGQHVVARGRLARASLEDILADVDAVTHGFALGAASRPE
jgi:cytosine/adenosine deaminase-related metal-dependent hydrolase